MQLELSMCKYIRNLYTVHCIYRGRDSAVGIAIRYGTDGQEIEAGVGEIFRTRPDRLWGPSQPPVQWVLCLFPRGKAAEACR